MAVKIKNGGKDERWRQKLKMAAKIKDGGKN